MDRRAFLAGAAAACFVPPIAYAQTAKPVYPRDLLDRVHEIGRTTPGGPKQLQAALEAEFGRGEIVFRDETWTVLVDVSAVDHHPASDHPNVRGIPMRIVEPASWRSRDWILVFAGGPEWRRDYLKLG
ncbi:hypothetical protein DNX69_10845 [Rhodopseudomonas palustris]|uniref:Twin-arginine translocation pathway signal n=2 Tax=Rhodopseudomonas palustris TaxID=1076 RepID=A0A323UK03_RHOPL|nr:hypothetical protein DNX69_10845 [Rhodopseudomonas palustris]